MVCEVKCDLYSTDSEQGEGRWMVRWMVGEVNNGGGE